MSDPVRSRVISVFVGNFCRAAKVRLAAAVLMAFALLAVLPYAAAQDQLQQSAEPPVPTQQDSSATQVATTPAQTGLVHIVPYGRDASPIKNTLAPAGAHLTYWGGPVISQIHVVAVFWGPNVNTAITTGAIDQYFRDITNSRYYDLLTEYSTVGLIGAGVPATSSNQSIQRGDFGGSFTIVPSVCNVTPPATCAIDDTQIQAELRNQINAGHLPAAASDVQGNVNSFYMIYFPPGVSITVGVPPVGSCVQGGFCAYHSNTPGAPASSPRLVPYGVLPDFGPTSGCSAGCGRGTLFQNVTAVTSHEMAEAVTDAQVGSATAFAPPLAWYDPDPATNPLAEIGDICTQQDAVVTAGANIYTVQTEFSNVQNDCVSAPPVFSLSGPAAVTQAISANVTLTIQSSVTASTLTGYIGTVHFTSTDPLAVLPADYTFTASDAGTHTFPVTLKSLSTQSITVTDVRSAGFTGTVTFNVANGPDLVISKTHSGNVTVGQTGASYTITVTNAGTAATVSGVPVTVTDTLPVGLTATAIAGAGWTCSALPALSCTRSDSLAAGASFPPLTLTVDVTASSPTTVTNSAAVSGGSDSNANNNTALDPTIIGARPPSDLTITSFHGSAFVQSQTGIYTITVRNSGPGASFGPVTVTDTLPASLTGSSISGTGWSCSAPTAVPITCTRSDALPATGIYPQITLLVNVAADAPSQVTHTVTVSGGNDGNSANNVASDPTDIIVNGADLNITPLTPFDNFVQGQSNLQALFTVANHGSIASSGTITVTGALSAGLTATAISGSGWTCTLATLTCSRSESLPVSMGFASIVVTFDIAKTAPTNSSIAMTVSGGSDVTPNNNTGTYGVIVSPAIQITLVGPGVHTVTAGSAATYNMSLTLQPAAGTVTLSCSGLPQGAACNFSPASFNASGAEVVTISTTSRSLTVPSSFRPPDRSPLQVLLLLLALGALATLALSKQQRRLRFGLAAASLLLFCAIPGCGGGSSNNFTGGPTPVPTPTPNPNGTPVGTYAISVTASGSSSPATQPLTLIVQ